MPVLSSNLNLKDVLMWGLEDNHTGEFEEDVRNATHTPKREVRHISLLTTQC